jgi:hypothetical protein
MEKTLKTREKMRLYRDIRSYEKYDKNIICMPRQHMNITAQSKENQEMEGGWQ